MNEPDLAAAIQFAPARVRPWLLLGAYAGLRAVEDGRGGVKRHRAGAGVAARLGGGRRAARARGVSA
jgi:hypothetical protein